MMITGLRDSGPKNSKITPLLWEIMPRGFALFLGLFSGLNLLARFRSTRLDENLWWIDLRWCPPILANTFLFVSTLCLLAFALRWPCSAWRRNLTMASAGGLALVCLLNAAEFYLLAGRGMLRAAVPVPLSLLVALAFGLILLSAAPARPPGS